MVHGPRLKTRELNSLQKVWAREGYKENESQCQCYNRDGRRKGGTGSNGQYDIHLDGQCAFALSGQRMQDAPSTAV